MYWDSPKDFYINWFGIIAGNSPAPLGRHNPFLKRGSITSKHRAILRAWKESAPLSNDKDIESSALCRKVVPAIFWDSKGLILEYHLEKDCDSPLVQPKIFSSQGITKVVKRSFKCIKKQGEYVDIVRFLLLQWKIKTYLACLLFDLSFYITKFVLR